MCIRDRNTVAACIHQDQTLVDGQAVKLRLLEPMQAGNIVVPKNTLVAGTAKAVSYTHLDVYKRQTVRTARTGFISPTRTKTR